MKIIALSPSYFLRILARAASFAILIGSGMEPWSVKQLMIVDASFELIPQIVQTESYPSLIEFYLVALVYDTVLL